MCLVKKGIMDKQARTTKQHVAPNDTCVDRKNQFNLKDIKLLLGDPMEMI